VGGANVHEIETNGNVGGTVPYTYLWFKATVLMAAAFMEGRRLDAKT